MSSLKRPGDDDITPPSTPKKANLEPFHSPWKPNSVVHSTKATSDLDTEQREVRARKQDNLKAIMQEELGHTTFDGEWVRGHFCPVPLLRDKRVFDELKDKAWTMKGRRFTVVNWPVGTEHKFYDTFVRLLNQVLDVFKNCFPNEYDKSIYRMVQFHKNDKNMAENVAGEDPLKPDILGRNESDHDDHASWYKAYLICEVKSAWAELIAQAGTYARCQFVASDHRIFIPVLGFNQKEAEFRLCFYHRGGVLATTAMKLNTQAGFQDFVSTIVGMWHWKSLEQAGYMTTQTTSHFCFNNIPFNIHRILCRRQVVRGRATTVYVVSRQPLPVGARRYLPAPAITDKGPAWKRLNPFDTIIPELPPSSQQLALDLELHESFIVKCSYQPPERDREDDIFATVKGYIGIPDIITTYDAPCLEIPHDEAPRFWNLWQKKERPFERRVHRHLIIKTMGQRLSPELTFRQLGYAIRDAMIGHCALFTEGGYLHRDVSCGNIVLLPEDDRTERKLPKLLEGIVKNKTCTAVLIDGDVAKKWGSAARSSHRSGTLPFVSLRLIEAWNEPGAELDHMPIDDLESFAWVLLYIILDWTPGQAMLHNERTWWDGLNNEGHKGIEPIKALVTLRWLNNYSYLQVSARVGVLREWIHDMFQLSNNLSGRYRQCIKEQVSSRVLMGVFEEAYKEFIGLAEKHIPRLPDVQISTYSE